MRNGHHGEHDLQAGPLPTHQEVARDVLGRFQDLGSRYWGWVTVLAFLFLLGVVGFVIRLSDGFADENRANWGYFVAALAFIVTTFTAMPVISAGLRLAKANWRRPLTRVTENMAITGLLVVLMLIPALIALPLHRRAPQHLVRVSPGRARRMGPNRLRHARADRAGAPLGRRAPRPRRRARPSAGLSAPTRHQMALARMGRQPPPVARALSGRAPHRRDVPPYLPPRPNADDLRLPSRAAARPEGRHHPGDGRRQRTARRGGADARDDVPDAPAGRLREVLQRRAVLGALQAPARLLPPLVLLLVGEFHHLLVRAAARRERNHPASSCSTSTGRR